jgi:hypothetical protein
MWPFNKPKVEFRYLIPNMNAIMPIIPAKAYKHAWAKRARAHMTELMQNNPDLFKEKFVHITKCVGIRDIMQRGWIVRSWMDIVIETASNGTDVKWFSPLDQREFLPRRDAISFHAPEQLSDFYESWPDDALRMLIKINTPWAVKVPRGYSMLLMPVAYADESRFTVMSGLIQSDLPAAPINVQMRWHVKEGKELIKAGTPLAQLILIKDDDVEATQVYREDDDMLFGSYLLYNNRFSRMYSDIKLMAKNDWPYTKEK